VVVADPTFDIYADGPGEILAHRLAVRRYSWSLEYQHAVGVLEFESSTAHESGDLSQKQKRIGARVARIVVREQLAHVAFAQSANNGVHERMREHIGVGMTFQAALVGDHDATQHEPPPMRKRVHVIAQSYAHVATPSPTSA
jgi:hypothetical protein